MLVRWLKLWLVIWFQFRVCPKCFQNAQHAKYVWCTHIRRVQDNVQKVGPWCKEFERLNPGFISTMQVDDENRFVSVTIFPTVSLTKITVARMNMTQADCAHTEHRLYKGQLMVMVGNGNGKVVNIAIQLCPHPQVLPTCIPF